MMLIKQFLIIVSLVMVTLQVSALTHINETVGDFRISFDDKDDINIVAKAWNLTSGGLLDASITNQTLDIKTAYLVLAGNMTEPQSDNTSEVMVIILNNPINTIDAEKKFFENSSTSYIQVYDRKIDNHTGIYALKGNSLSDPNMDYIGLYWLDESAADTATKLVAVMSNEPKPVAEIVIDSIHVEEIAPNAYT